MKLLFVCNASVKDGTLCCASWILGIIGALGAEDEVFILSSGDDPQQNSVTAQAQGKSVCLIGYRLSGIAGSAAAAAALEAADVVLIFGTESYYTLPVMQYCEKSGILDKTVLFAQGMAYACARHYAEGVPYRVYRRWTVRDILRRQNIGTEQKILEKKAQAEKQAMQLTRHMIGRTTFDRAILQMYNADAAYYRCNDLLRSCFYEGEWRREKCIPHRIFISQYYYPLKGFHYLLEAAAQLKEKYPDLCIAAAGYNPIHSSVTLKELKDSSYIRYLKELIGKYRLQDNIELLGECSAQRMKEEYCKANVFVLPSTIENSPNSLAEAMMLGVPTVAADVGGVSDFAVHNSEAYLYPSPAAYLLAYYIDRIFADPREAERLSANGRQRALREYDRQANIGTIKDTLRIIAGKSKKYDHYLFFKFFIAPSDALL